MGYNTRKRRLPLISNCCIAAANSALQGPIRQARASRTLPTAPCAPLAPTNLPLVLAMPQPASCALLDDSLLLPTPADVVMLQQAGTAQFYFLSLGLSLLLGRWLLLVLC